MNQIHACITGVTGFLPSSVLDNATLSPMVGVDEEWIIARTGIRQLHIMEGEEGSAHMAVHAVADLLQKTQTRPEEVDLVICTTVTPSYSFPSNAVVVCDSLHLNNAFAYDLAASCSGFLFGLETCNNMILSGKYKKVVLVASEKLSSMVNYKDAQTAPLFGDASAAVMVEPTTEALGVVDSILRVDGGRRHFLYRSAGGSKYPLTPESLEQGDQYIHQDGHAVFKRAVSEMSRVTLEMMDRHHLTADDIDWYIPHQANIRIIDAIASRLSIPESKVLTNIAEVGNTSSCSIPLCMWQYEQRLRKGDTLLLSSFGAGFTWGCMYIKWGYDA